MFTPKIIWNELNASAQANLRLSTEKTETSKRLFRISHTIQISTLTGSKEENQWSEHFIKMQDLTYLLKINHAPKRMQMLITFWKIYT